MHPRVARHPLAALSSPPLVSFENPVRLGPYTLLEPLGQGGMAQVFIARRDGAGQLTVLKLLHANMVQNAEAARRFLREANIASQLQHPGIAQVLDAGWEADRFYLVMELISGETLEALLKACRARGGVPPPEITVAVMLQALDALHYAHGLSDAEGQPLGLVHRDLSPRNVMVGYDGRARIIDFGIAKGAVDEFKTAAGMLMGTPYYMSPEQAAALPVDHRSDLYTMGAVLFELLTGRRLVEAKGRPGILRAVVSEPPTPLRAANPHAPAALEAVLQRVLAKEPARRFTDARAFADALRAAAGPLANAGQGAVAQHMRQLFAAQIQADAARRRLAEETPSAEPTRMASRTGDLVTPSPLSPPDAAQARTRTAYRPGEGPAHDPTRLATPPGAEPVTADLVDPTRVATGLAPALYAAIPPPRARAPGRGLMALGLVLLLGSVSAVLVLRARTAPMVLESVPQPAPTAAASAAPASAAEPPEAAEPRPDPAEAAPASPRPGTLEHPDAPPRAGPLGTAPSGPAAQRAPEAPDGPPRAGPLGTAPPAAAAQRAPEAPDGPPRAGSLGTAPSGPAAQRAPEAPDGPRPATEPAARRSPEPPDGPRPAPPPGTAPEPAPRRAPEPPVATAPSRALAARLAALSQQRDRSAAFALAKDLQAAARDLPAAQRARVQSEVDRVFYTQDVDVMVDALRAGLRELQAAEGPP
jgi:tRNA A-37 threonylcarbamoyl transferase component Bud32